MSPRKTPTVAGLRHTIDNTIRLLDATKPKLAEAITRAENDTDDGHKPQSLQPPVSGGNTDPDLFTRAFTKIGKGDDTRWVPKRDVIRDALEKLISSIDQAAIEAATALTSANELCAITTKQAQQLLDATDTAHCANCGKPVARTRADPLRAGRCFDCYRYRLTHDGTERPRTLWVT